VLLRLLQGLITGFPRGLTETKSSLLFRTSTLKAPNSDTLFFPMWYFLQAREGQEPPRENGGSPAASRFQVEPYAMRGPVPWAHLSPQTRRDFTLGHAVPVRHFFKNSTGDIQDLSHLWSAPVIDALVERAAARNASSLLCSYGAACNEAVFGALARTPLKGGACWSWAARSRGSRRCASASGLSPPLR